jgi:hypothetical protein
MALPVRHMQQYRIYTLLSDNKVAGPATEIECSSDEEAISQAEKFVNGLDIEVWQGARLVTRLRSPHRPKDAWWRRKRTDTPT